MNSFLKSFLPLLKRLKLKKYLLEIFLLTVAVIVTITALVLYAKNSQSAKEEFETSEISQISPVSSLKIFVDVSGAVKKPNIYEIGFGARIKEIINKAGGLSDDADVMFFNRNFNLARIVADQEKIYIPSVTETNSGIFIQNQRTLDYNSPSTATQNVTGTGLPESQSLININYATIEELDQLPGIGQATANKIIINRPYAILEELLTKKAVNKGVFERIKNLISI